MTKLKEPTKKQVLEEIRRLNFRLNVYEHIIDKMSKSTILLKIAFLTSICLNIGLITLIIGD